MFYIVVTSCVAFSTIIDSDYSNLSGFMDN